MSGHGKVLSLHIELLELTVLVDIAVTTSVTILFTKKRTSLFHSRLFT